MAKQVHYQIREDERYSVMNRRWDKKRVSLCKLPIRSAGKGTSDVNRVTCSICRRKIDRGELG